MEKLNLKKISCIIVDGFNPPDQVAKVLNYCGELCDFHSIKLFSFEKPKIEFNYEFINVGRLSYVGFSHFMIRKLVNYIDAEYVLVLNHDGFIVNVKKWEDDFLNYDYIGGPWWPGTLPNNRVGNGGFSLRSKNLIERCSKDDIVVDFNMHEGTNDDKIICSTNKNLIEESGLTYAPLEVAARFSWAGDIPEINRTWKDCFGAHCRIPEFLNLVK